MTRGRGRAGRHSLLRLDRIDRAPLQEVDRLLKLKVLGRAKFVAMGPAIAWGAVAPSSLSVAVAFCCSVALTASSAAGVLVFQMVGQIGLAHVQTGEIALWGVVDLHIGGDALGLNRAAAGV